MMTTTTRAKLGNWKPPFFCRFITILLIYAFLALGCKSSDQNPPVSPYPMMEWPRTYQNDGRQVVIFQPQVLSWQDQTTLKFRAAVAVMENGAKQPVYGVMSASAITVNDLEDRIAYLFNMQMDVAFPGVDQAKSQALQAVVQQTLPSFCDSPVSIDCLITNLDSKSFKPNTVKVNLDPPPIHYFDTPAILVIFNGTPDLKPVKDTQLNYAVNTNWDLLQDQTTSKYYLLNGDSWLTATDVMNGPWTAADSLPDNFAKLPADTNWDEVRKHIPGKPADSVPTVVATTQPAEMIVTDGAPKLVDIPGTALQYVSNPTMPLFYDTADSNYYYLVAGRWFSTRNLQAGDWSAASAQLPDDFGKIPPDGPMGSVLASVPGTPQAQDAIVLASIPHEADIDINKAKVDVTYIGDPQFVPIEGTSMTYAVNTSYQVIAVSGQYYCCYQGVWFVSPQQTGQWVVCTFVPTVIYTIPPTYPVYNCTYVQVYSVTPTTVVVGYTAGYDGAYVSTTGTVMFGAGVVVGAAFVGPAFACCYPSYYSYGCCARYSYVSGGYYRAGSCYGPYGGAGYAAKYNPSTGTYSRSGYAYGPAGAAGYRQAYNPYTHTYASRAGGTNGYSSWGSASVAHNGNWATGGHVSGPGGSYGWARTSNGGYASAGRGANGDVYAGADGNVYKKNSDGQWQEHSNGSSGWSNVDRGDSNFSHGTGDQLDSDAASRDRGNFNSDSFSNFRSGGGFGGGGFDRGGGGFGGGGFGGGGFGGRR
jgi:hypothetical protein